MILLRDALYSDCTAIAKLHAASWQKFYRGILSDHYLDNEVVQDRLHTWNNRLKVPAANQQLTVATLNNEIAGFACLFLDDDTMFGSLLDNLHVSAQQQKSGIGKLLMKECVKKVRNKGTIKKMYLWAYEQNTDARKVYEHLDGFCYETIESVSEDGIARRVCRYTWDDVFSVFN
jgi:ribosomal protein S18 acetylase RimI-like enzyme